ncbi:MAG: hypothetical protein K6A33_12980 [Clostridiales bacterium]|nr:hypothetical protein [Clostridiales bacterium]
MKKLSFLLLFILTAAVLAITVSAGTVMYQGGGAEGLYRTGYTGPINIERYFQEPFNLEDADYLYLRVYIDDPEKYAENGQIEITSSGKCDAEEHNWNLSTLDMQQGWNEWKLDLYEGGESGGPADFARINYFRIYFFTEGDNLIALDYVAFGGENEDFSSIATELGEVEREEHVAQDVINRVGKGSSGAVAVQAAMEASPANADPYDYVFIALTLDGVDNFTGDGQLELTSACCSDRKEIHWLVSGLDLQDGLNEIKLDLWEPDEYGADFDPANINYFRIYMFTEGVLKMNLDYVGFGNDGDDFGYDLPVYLIPSEDAPELSPEEQAARAEEAAKRAEEAAKKKAEEEAKAAEEAAKKAEEEAAKAAEEAAKKAEEEAKAAEEAAKQAADEAAKAAEEAAKQSEEDIAAVSAAVDEAADAVIGGEDGQSVTVSAGPNPALIAGICVGAVAVIGVIVGIAVSKKKRG